MINTNEIVLIYRDEIETIAKRAITDDEWLKVKEYIATDDTMWAVIDVCVQRSIEEVITDEDQQKTGESN